MSLLEVLLNNILALGIGRSGFWGEAPFSHTSSRRR